MTNILNLPMIDGANTTFAISFDSDWKDALYVGQPGFAADPIAVTGALSDSESITGLSSTTGIVPGCLAVGVGIQSGTLVEAVSGTTLTLSKSATINANAVPIYIFPPPLDLTGISFRCQIRSAIDATTPMIDLSTANGLMLNGGTNGLFGFNVPALTLRKSALLSAVKAAGGQLDLFGDITATDASGTYLNLCSDAPFAVQARVGITQ